MGKSDYSFPWVEAKSILPEPLNNKRARGSGISWEGLRESGSVPVMLRRGWRSPGWAGSPHCPPCIFLPPLPTLFLLPCVLHQLLSFPFSSPTSLSTADGSCSWMGISSNPHRHGDSGLRRSFTTECCLVSVISPRAHFGSTYPKKK